MASPSPARVCRSRRRPTVQGHHRRSAPRAPARRPGSRPRPPPAGGPGRSARRRPGHVRTVGAPRPPLRQLSVGTNDHDCDRRQKWVSNGSTVSRTPVLDHRIVGPAM
ncbi:hypothetical protein E1193_13220 [Micromonospora sp. KC606]|nr:hypothetical protein E1193_13220 [Micromonospora sp. KC606]